MLLKSQHALRTTHYALRITLPFAALITFLGYVAPWVPHRAAGLVITGLDLAEYVKFLHPVRSGEIGIWREGFYLPLVAVSLTLSLIAYRKDLRYPWPIRIGMLILAGVAALNLLPPAWSPPLLMTPEFRTQTAAMVFCLGMAAISPFLTLLPRIVTPLTILILAVLALIWPVVHFLRILPAIESIYGHALTPGWGLWIMAAGLVGMMAGALIWRLEIIRPLRTRIGAELPRAVAKERRGAQ
ncbi:MAG: hypothetical protein KF893_19905 [Caldilineaceae bacterium]|nr:hypothetical protein [Caldilineaceae bacterium]